MALTGYAAQYADAFKKYKNSSTAHTMATLANGGTGLDNSWLDNYANSLGGKVNNYMDPRATSYAPRAQAPDAYSPGDAPEQMDYAEALAKAKARVNPTYDALRGKAEQSYSAQREQIPQLLAARYGMSGTRGGRRQSQEYGVTQAENQGISDIEGQRLTAQEETAMALQNDENNKSMQAYQLAEAAKLQKYANAYQQYRDSVMDQQTESNTNYDRQLKQLLMNREDQRYGVQDDQWDKTFGLQQGQFDLQKNGLENSPEYQALQMEGMKANNAATWRSAKAPFPSSGGGGLTAYQQYQVGRDQEESETQSQNDFNARVDAAAKSDPRLENPSLGRFANNTTVFSLAALQDAYRELYKKQALSR